MADSSAYSCCPADDIWQLQKGSGEDMMKGKLLFTDKNKV
jgi:hypothetical protein